MEMTKFSIENTSGSLISGCAHFPSYLETFDSIINRLLLLGAHLNPTRTNSFLSYIMHIKLLCGYGHNFIPSILMRLYLNIDDLLF